MDLSNFFSEIKKGYDTTTILFVYLSIAFTLMITVFNYKSFLKKNNDYKSFLLYFLFFFIVFLCFPVFIIIVFHQNPIDFLSSSGFQFGNFKTGLMMIIIFIPIAVLSAYVGSRDQIMVKQYPFSKDACKSDKKFFVYEISYLILYYFSWEFLFRGILFFPLISITNLPMAIVIQTIISTVYHIGHPKTEIYGAFLVGFLFAIMAYLTKSFFYVFIIHAMIGIFTDTSLYLKYHRKQEVRNKL